MSLPDIDTTYEPFSREPEYIELNRAFVESLDLSNRGAILDLACGTGTLADLILARHEQARIVGLDLSRESLMLARAHFDGRAGSPQLVEGSADRLPFRDASFDAVLMGNSIHNLPDLPALLGGVQRVLRPGGLFAFNTSFWAGTFPPGTERFYREWLVAALAQIAAMDSNLKAEGRPGIERRRGRAAPAFSRPWRTPEGWSEALTSHGFEEVAMRRRSVQMTRRSFETVGAYTGLAAVLLSGYPEKIASEALMASAGPTLAALGHDSLERLWLEVAACRTT